MLPIDYVHTLFETNLKWLKSIAEDNEDGDQVYLIHGIIGRIQEDMLTLRLLGDSKEEIVAKINSIIPAEIYGEDYRQALTWFSDDEHAWDFEYESVKELTKEE